MLGLMSSSLKVTYQMQSTHTIQQAWGNDNTIPRDKKLFYIAILAKILKRCTVLVDRSFNNVYALTDGYSVYYNLAK